MDEKTKQEEQPIGEVSDLHQQFLDIHDILNHSNIVIVRTNQEGRFTYVNEALSLTTGFQIDEILGKHFIDFIHPNDKDRVTHIFQEAFISPKGYTQLEVGIINKQGNTKHMFASVDSVKQQGKIVGFSAVLTDITERKLAEEALKVTEEKYRNLVENAPIGIGITTLDGRPVLRNKAMAKLYGFGSIEELMQEHTLARYYDAKDRERFIAKARSGIVKDFEVKFKRRDGTVFWGSLTAIPHMTELGEGYFTVVQDITARKQSEEALHLRAALLDFSKDVILLRDFNSGPGAKFIYVNDSACKLYGYTRDEFMNMRMEDLAFNVDRKQVAKRRKIFAKKGEFQFQSVHRSKGGINIPVEQHSSIGVIGDRRYILTILRDITERKNSEQALKASEEKYRSLFNSMHEGVTVNEIIYDTSGNAADYLIVDINTAFESITGLNKEETIGMRGSEISGTLNPPFMNIYSRVAESGKPALFETYYRPMKKYFNLSVSSYRKGTFITVFFDMTSSKKANREILSYQKELRSLAYQLSLAEERSRRAIAIEVHDGLGQSLALCRMKLGELKRDVGLSSPHLTGQIVELETPIKKMINEVRSLTFELSSPLLYDVGLEAAIEQLTEQMQERFNVNFSFNKSRQPRQLSIDIRVLLFQIVRELCLNIIKHSQARHATVSIKNYNSRILIKVEDDGVGFDVASLDNPKNNSKGFGLFSVRERLHPIGGDMKIESQRGEGTTVTLKVPLKAK